MNTSHTRSETSVADTMAGLLSGEILKQNYPGGLHAAAGSAGKHSASAGGGTDVQGTTAKTCTPTRNPCCKSSDDSAPGGQGGDDVQATKAKTCKPTRNPCCRGAEELVDDTEQVQATTAKTCKPTRNPCCKES